jgi:hypothetical protein
MSSPTKSQNCAPWAMVDILKQSADFSGVGVDMFAEKIAGKEEFVWTVFVEGDQLQTQKVGRKQPKLKLLGKHSKL